MKQTNKKIVALYKGEEFIDAGTYKEIATNQHMSIRYLRSIKSKTPKRLAHYENEHYRNGMLIINL